MKITIRAMIVMTTAAPSKARITTGEGPELRVRFRVRTGVRSLRRGEFTSEAVVSAANRRVARADSRAAGPGRLPELGALSPRGTAVGPGTRAGGRATTSAS